MSKHIVIDPITRIEGHLRIEAVIDENNVVTEAYSSSTMFRGIEEILKGRDPRDCGLLAMRICGVCTGTHYQRSIEAVEHAFKITIPKNARLVRNLIQGLKKYHADYDSIENVIQNIFQIKLDSKNGTGYFESLITPIGYSYKYLAEIKKKIASADCEYVGFDIFDTLIERPFWKPIDLFKFLDTKFNELLKSINIEKE